MAQGGEIARVVENSPAQVLDKLVRPERLLRGLRPLGLADARLALKGDQIACGDLSNSLVFCREFELRRRTIGAGKGFSNTENYGAPGEIRTPGLLVRSQALYPTELRARKGREYYHIIWRAPFR
jgi:hypothetical protein